jgi:hypothetical protein
MKNKLLRISDQENSWIQEEANKFEITFTEMFRRIIAERYEKKQDSNLNQRSKICLGNQPKKQVEKIVKSLPL